MACAAKMDHYSLLKPTWISRKRSQLNRICFSTLFLFSLFPHAICENNITKSCAEFYEKGVESYLENNFAECASNLENALLKYRQYSRTLQNCRLKCKIEAEESEPLYPVDIENLMFFERTIRATLCIIKCKAELTDDMEKYNINEETESLFEKRKPYEYLHICYFQLKDLQKAASSVFTYLMSHPEDKTMLATLKYYSSFDDVDMKEIVNYEARDYVYLYSHGAAAYDEKEWKTVINNMEESLTDFIHAEEECRAQCEGSFDHGWFPDFIPSIANHFTYCLKCKSRCYPKLNSINGERYEDLLPSHYNYLQYAYYKVGDLKKACQTVASFLLFSPNDESMLSNMKYYMKLPKVETDLFTPRPEAVKYIQRQSYEKKLLKFIEKEFQFSAPLSEDLTKNKRPKFTILKTGSDLKGPNRFVSEGLLTKKECRTIVDIIKTFSIIGDGYDTASPHSDMERFEGLNLERTILLVYFGILNSRHLKMILEVTEDTKEKIMRYFNITQPLYFTYTHLVCRSPLKGSQKNRLDLSHEIHADNCNIYPDGECEKLPPSYTWRDYSAILYLNSNFEGGEFFFSSDMKPESIQSSVSPTCGRMVSFSSGGENLHGVKAVQTGSRCAIGLWFTFNPEYKEKSRDLAYDFLSKGKSMID